MQPKDEKSATFSPKYVVLEQLQELHTVCMRERETERQRDRDTSMCKAIILEKHIVAP